MSSRRRLLPVLLFTSAAVVLSGCTQSTPAPDAEPSTDVTAVTERLTEISENVSAWADAASIDEAHLAAAAASTLVTGPDTDLVVGEIATSLDEGLLPTATGNPGLALAVEDCAGPDLLGGPWTDAAARWAAFDDLFAAWTPTNNTFPQLASHPLRIVGWAQLTLATDDLDVAHEYAGHAALHVTAAQNAVAACG